VPRSRTWDQKAASREHPRIEPFMAFSDPNSDSRRARRKYLRGLSDYLA
jgi:hypothetical protein